MYSQIRKSLIVCIVCIASGSFFQMANANTEANKAVIAERWLEMANTSDLSIADEIYADDFTSHIPNYPQVVDPVYTCAPAAPVLDGKTGQEPSGCAQVGERDRNVFPASGFDIPSLDVAHVVNHRPNERSSFMIVEIDPEPGLRVAGRPDIELEEVIGI